MGRVWRLTCAGFTVTVIRNQISSFNSPDEGKKRTDWDLLCTWQLIINLRNISAHKSHLLKCSRLVPGHTVTAAHEDCPAAMKLQQLWICTSIVKAATCVLGRFGLSALNKHQWENRLKCSGLVPAVANLTGVYPQVLVTVQIHNSSCPQETCETFSFCKLHQTRLS